MVTPDLLAAYRVPSSAIDGVLITLPDAPAVTFRVRLPSRHNRAYQAAIQLAVGRAATIGDGGVVQLDPERIADMAESRLEAFLAHCLDLGSLPTGIDADALRGAYRPALEALYEQALILADAEEGEADAAVGKSPAISDGRPNGKAGKPSTTASPPPAGLHPPIAGRT